MRSKLIQIVLRYSTTEFDRAPAPWPSRSTRSQDGKRNAPQRSRRWLRAMRARKILDEPHLGQFEPRCVPEARSSGRAGRCRKQAAEDILELGNSRRFRCRDRTELAERRTRLEFCPNSSAMSSGIDRGVGSLANLIEKMGPSSSGASAAVRRGSYRRALEPSPRRQSKRKERPVQMCGPYERRPGMPERARGLAQPNHDPRAHRA